MYFKHHACSDGKVRITSTPFSDYRSNLERLFLPSPGIRFSESGSPDHSTGVNH
jgi:hypothetical protein